MKMDLSACIFNIQKFSIHDGPGIRTTVFFKGCPLRCTWCANPESIRSGRQVLWDKAKCMLCGNCVEACPVRALALGNDKVSVAHQKCIGCDRCVQACPNAALSLSGKSYGIEEVMAVCLQDKDFYDESGGGVTLSGGEVMMQPEFVGELLRQLRDHGIHTALETNGFVQPEVFRHISGTANLLLFDVKHYDAKRHVEGTGVDNGPILDNLEWAVAHGKDLLVRIPVIPGYNDSVADASGFAGTLSSIHVDRVQLLPFHQFGQNKYHMLGMAYELDELPQLRKEDLVKFREMLVRGGVKEVIL